MNRVELHILFIVFAILCSHSGIAQRKPFEIYKGDTVNRVNVNGGWQGRGVFIYESPNEDTVISDGFYTDGKRTGLWKVYYNTGKLKAELTYLKGYVDGKVRLYYANGCIAEEGTWKDGWLNEYTQYYADSCGWVMCKINYGSKRKDAAYREEWPHHVESYKVKAYSPKEPVCCGCDSIKTDSSTQFFQNSKKTHEIIQYPNGWTKTYDYITHEASKNFIWRKTNRALDTISTYWQDSTLETIFRFDKSKSKTSTAHGALYEHQRILVYHKNGKINSVTNFKIHSYNFLFYINGLYSSYYPNGNKKEEGKYKVYSRTRNPAWPRMDMTPKYWPDSRKKGKWITYFEDGKISGIYRYRRGYIMRKKIFDESGNIIENKKHLTINSSIKKEAKPSRQKF